MVAAEAGAAFSARWWAAYLAPRRGIGSTINSPGIAGVPIGVRIATTIREIKKTGIRVTPGLTPIIRAPAAASAMTPEVVVIPVAAIPGAEVILEVVAIRAE